jgi:hypothetical protein
LRIAEILSPIHDRARPGAHLISLPIKILGADVVTA